MPLVKVGKNHQIKLPKELIDNLNISVGDYLEMNEQATQIVIQLVKSGKADAEEFPGNGKWAQVAERVGKGNLLDREAGETLRKASQEFRDNFRFREPPDFKHIENDS
ncbi:MAG: AbrB/MazE/SpoVT family DNA-binding domain-containing protein [Desulfobacterales bacterium]|nr:AbrB/MazE/SpoVT family DNA-binding domain-containing protein [Desulfobacterales bacterium]